MPIIVNELVFKGEIASPPPRNEPAQGPRRPAGEQQALIEACVAEVMKILEQRGER